MKRIYRWQPAYGRGLEHMILTQDEGMIVAEGVVAVSTEDVSLRYRLTFELNRSLTAYRSSL